MGQDREFHLSLQFTVWHTVLARLIHMALSRFNKGLKVQLLAVQLLLNSNSTVWKNMIHF